MYYDLNGVPDGARFTDLIPANRDPTAPANATPTAAALPAEFLRPYRGLSEHPRARQLRRGRLSGAPGAGEPPLHPRRAVRRRATRCSARAAPPTRIPATCRIAFNRPYDFFYSELTQSNRQQPDHQLLVGPAGAPHRSRCACSLDGWQVSGESDFVSGDWAQRLDDDDRCVRLHRRRSGQRRVPRGHGIDHLAVPRIWCGRT